MRVVYTFHRLLNRCELSASYDLLLSGCWDSHPSAKKKEASGNNLYKRQNFTLALLFHLIDPSCRAIGDGVVTHIRAPALAGVPHTPEGLDTGMVDSLLLNKTISIRKAAVVRHLLACYITLAAFCLANICLC